MLRHIIILAFRKFRRNKPSFFINLIGLSTGLVGVLLIYLWVTDELNMDKFHENDAQLYQVMQHFKLPNGVQTWKHTPGPFAPALVEELPEVEKATHINAANLPPKGVMIQGKNKLTVKGLFVDEHFFEVFTYPMIVGGKQNVLSDKNSLAISESTATKLFGTPEEAVGKDIQWKNRFFDNTFTITGVFENPPANSSTQFDAVVHYDWLVDWDEYANDWSGGYAETFVVLKKGTDVGEFNQKIADYLHPKFDFWKDCTLFATSYSDNYLYGNYEDGILIGGRIEYVRLFSLIALFILLIACINFMNLSTAQASKNAKEIGVKKAVGVQRKSLIAQFLGESVIVAVLSLVVALALVSLLLPQFNIITDKAIQLNLDWSVILSILGIVILTGLLAGSYPAFYLSGFNPTEVLKGKRQTSMGEKWIREGLVVFQFGLSLIFIVGVLVINQQMDYIQTKKMGYDRNNIISFERPQNDGDPQIFLSELRNISGVEKAGNMSWNILSGKDNQSGYSWSGDEAEKDILFQAPRLGYRAVETLGMELIAGRAFSPEHQDDNTKIILNESAVKMMGLKQPLGHILDKSIGDGRTAQREIIGVVRDFHYGSIHHQIEPLVLRFRSMGRNIMVKLRPGMESTTIPTIQNLFKKFHPDYEFDYTFMDEDYTALYTAESNVATLTKYFSGLAIIISCLGLLGLAIFTAERRRKEIGIRKVLGASILGIVELLTRDFSKTVLIAVLVSMLVSYWVVQNWLNNFAYKIELSGWFFVIPAVLVFVIAWFTVGLQTIRAAQINPVECLKEE